MHQEGGGSQSQVAQALPHLIPPRLQKPVASQFHEGAIVGLVVMMMRIRVIMMVMTVTPQWREGQRKHGSICSWATEAAPLQIP